MSIQKTFLYDVSLFRNKLLKRTWAVVSLFVVFVAYNSLQVPKEGRIQFFTIFVPLLVLFFWFLRKNYLKQIEILSSGRIEIEGGSLKQFDSNGNCASLRMKDLEQITIDKFRGYNRIVLETKEKIYPLVNIENQEELVSLLEKESGLKRINDLTEDRIWTLKTPLYFIPSILVLIATYLPMVKEKFPILSNEFLGLFFNVNLIIYLLYLPEKQNYTISQFSLKRRMIFISLVVFFFQVYIQLDKSGWLKN
ncbi:hypothetical protein [Leptospira bandrabouensis]|uniref:hypothetical protein n=1 Tax=Leptospira bandrabouensis TaxID=2484903 RepID=UPI001EE78B6C|nr:hypothetical protein [Leptospira bandrabouensis]MCG6145676.1 hypothetical protein [Leptospira bandrabouensis]MCG6153299.1 hypothetical protein [Leptospira bandrabouensis]MCG6160782.1 hypothetical protein [Leptospira bandrabouensis]MCG6165322.1 hypothetical protein [Leptospira bandrabouensis]MCW7458590.1 hypothetical protein [Leptospira bandrabouensis]